MRLLSPSFSGWLAVLLLAGGRAVEAQPVAGTNIGPVYAPVHLNPVLYLPAQSQSFDRKKFVDQYAAPPVLFSQPAPAMTMVDPTALQTRTPADIQRQKHQEDLQKNWMLLTPAEILGVPEDKKGEDDPDQNLTAEQRYMKRLEMSRMDTNGTPAHTSLFDKSNWRTDNDYGSQLKNANGFFRGSQSSFSRVTTFEKPVTADDGFRQLPQTAPPSPWASSWAPPAEVTTLYEKNKLEQARVAEMARFRQILSPADLVNAKPLNAGNPTAGRRSDSQFPPASAVSPWGSGYVPVKDNIGRPKPLPSLFAAPSEKPPVDHSRHPSPPPWLAKPGGGNF